LFRFATNETPNICVETAELFPDDKKRVRILDRGRNLQSVAHDPGIAEQPFHIARAVMRDLLRAKTVERFAIVLSFLENRRPAEPGLRALEDQKFKQLSIIVNRHAPFSIMIGDVWFSSRPGTTRHIVRSKRRTSNTQRPTPKQNAGSLPFGGLRNRWSSEKIRPMEEKRKTFSARLARWAAELVLVFIGVSAAFWLNNYEQRKEEAKRRDQILASLEQTLREGLESGKINAAQEEKRAADFERALAAGEMPPLRPFVFETDYSPGDFATLLQAGGVQLLDIKTLTALRNDESIIRWNLARLARYQKLSDELIVPNLDQDISFFYDPATGKLRKRFQMYPDALEDTVKFAHELDRNHTELLKRIQAERRR
jgi:hypothetical protein